MQSIRMNFKDGADINAAYIQLKKLYPDAEIIKNDNPAITAMEKLQKAMAGEAERLGLQSEEDVMDMIKELRRENKI